MKKLSRKKYLKSHRRFSAGQAMVEFALVFPILLVLFVGIIEAAHLIFIYSSIFTSSREAARYGSAVGLITSDSEYFRYQDCAGIIESAKNVAFLTNPENMTIIIEYDAGEGNEGFGYSDFCVDEDGDGIDSGVDITPLEVDNPDSSNPEDTIFIPKRIVVTVSTEYQPLVPLLPQFIKFTMETESARTFLGTVKYWPDQ